MTASTDITRSPHMAISPSQSLEDLHFNLAQEITREMTKEMSMSRNYSPTSSSTPPSTHVADDSRHSQTNSRNATIQTYRIASPQKIHSAGITKSTSPVKIHTRAPVVKPSPAEEELVRRIHKKVGGPSKLSTYDDPAKVRHVVIEALATEQVNASDAARIRKGQLSVFERRVVRTVTNRGAAVRSRMRQRKEVAHLKQELRIRDGRVRHLENIVRSLCLRYSAPLPEVLAAVSYPGGSNDNPMSQVSTETEPEIDSSKSFKAQGIKLEGIDAPDFALNQELFGTLVDQMITHPPWC